MNNEERKSGRSLILAAAALVAGAILLSMCSREEPGKKGPAAPAAKQENYTETIKNTSVTFDMVWVPEGNFWIGKTEVTWDEFLSFAMLEFESGENPPPAIEGVGTAERPCFKDICEKCAAKGEPEDGVCRPSVPLDTFPYDKTWGKGQRPAIGMSWNAARHYCKWLSANTGKTYRLPTEKEWEIAAGPRPDPMGDFAWTKENGGEKTQKVGQKKPNKYGLHDIYGNVWEYMGNPAGDEDAQQAVFRGGSFVEPAAEIGPDKRLEFDINWTVEDSNFPPGVWWVPDGARLGIRVLRPGPEKK